MLLTVCAFESARIILFRSRMPASPDDLSKTPDADAAIAKARTCLHIITKYFPSSAPIQPMVSRTSKASPIPSHPIPPHKNQPIGIERDNPDPVQASANPIFFFFCLLLHNSGRN